MKNEKLDISTPMAYSKIEFIETPIFAHLITNLMDDDNYSRLQRELIVNPEKGVLVIGGGGIRKIRWSLGRGRGKRSGVRIIYYYKNSKGQILMLFAYSKKMLSNLSDSQIKQFSRIAKEYQNEKEIHE